MGIELTKKQQRSLDYHMKKAYYKIEDINEKYCITGDIALEEYYIFKKKLIITIMKIVIKNVIDYLRSNRSIFYHTEYNELESLTDNLYHKLSEIDNKLEENYINMMTTKQWMKNNSMELKKIQSKNIH